MEMGPKGWLVASRPYHSLPVLPLDPNLMARCEAFLERIIQSRWSNFLDQYREHFRVYILFPFSVTFRCRSFFTCLLLGRGTGVLIVRKKIITTENSTKANL